MNCGVGGENVTMARMFNMREGLSARMIILPERLYETWSRDPPGKEITREDFANTLRFTTRPWDGPQTGCRPKAAELFGLDWLILRNTHRRSAEDAEHMMLPI